MSGITQVANTDGYNPAQINQLITNPIAASTRIQPVCTNAYNWTYYFAQAGAASLASPTPFVALSGYDYANGIPASLTDFYNNSYYVLTQQGFNFAPQNAEINFYWSILYLCNTVAGGHATDQVFLKWSYCLNQPGSAVVDITNTTGTASTSATGWPANAQLGVAQLSGLQVGKVYTAFLQMAVTSASGLGHDSGGNLLQAYSGFGAVSSGV